MFLLKQNSLTLGKRDPHDIVVTSSYLPDDDKEAEYGSVYFTYVLRNHRELASEIKQIIIASFQAHFYQDLERNAEQSFEETLQAINDSVNKLAQAENIVWSSNLNIALGVFSRHDLHLSVGGTGAIYLNRGQHLTLISDGLTQESEKAENKIFFSLASGNILANDSVVLSTEKLEEIVDITALKKRIKDMQSDEAIPSLKHAHLQIINCKAIEETEVEPVVQNHISNDTAKVGQVSSTNRFSNTIAILKENLKKGLERIFNRSDRPLVRKSLPLNKIIAGTVVAIIVLGGLYWLNGVQQTNSAKKDLQILLTQVSNDKEQVKSRINIDPISAKNLLVADQRKLNQALATTTDAILLAQIHGELSELQQLLETADKVYKIENPKIVYDLSQERSNFAGKGLVRLGNDLYALDSDAIYRLALDKPTRRTVIVNSNAVSGLELATSITKDNSLQLYTQDHKLIEFKNDTFTELKAPGTDGTTWKNAVDIVEYVDRKFMYFLDPKDNTIWRYGTDSSGFQAPISKNLAQLNLANAVSLAVDGAVYVLSADGQISKTYADEKQDFVIDGLTTDFNAPTKILADKNPDNGFLFVLDPKNKRIVVLSKTGKYQAQYVFPTIEDIIDIELVPSLTKDQLMVLTQSGKVIEVEINLGH